MKNILSILLLLSVFLFSCSKSGDSPNDINDTSGSILGSWKLEKSTNVHYDGYIDPFLTEVVVIIDTLNESGDDWSDEYWIFRDDGTMSWYWYDSDTLLSFDHHNYEKNEDEITWIREDGNIIWNVTSLTSNTLNIEDVYYIEQGTNTNDTTYFDRYIWSFQFIKSELPSITTELLNKKKPVNGYKSFLNRRN
tara:strand:+ start:103 stop:681 length:579 start_codon:yes stop_codon:yes gene_type:complete